jgi:hypothetical protein
MPCSTCGSILVVGKNNRDEMWCPTCENIEILSFEDSLKFCLETAGSYRQKYEALLQIVHKDNLLLPLLCLREKSVREVIQTMTISFQDLVGYSLILHDVLTGKCGGTVYRGKSLDLVRQIKKNYFDYVEALKQFQFTKDGYGVILCMPKDMSRFYINKETKTRKNALLMFKETDSSILAFWFTEEWPRIEKNFSKLDICSESEAKKRSPSRRRERKYHELREKRVKKKLKDKRREFRSPISAALGSAFQINLADPGNHMMDFDDIEISEEVVDALHHLVDYAEKQLPRSTSQSPREIEDLVVKRSYDEIFEYLETSGFNAEFVLQQLVSSEYNTKMFPLIVEDVSGLHLCPLTLRLLRLYFSDILRKDELQEWRSQQGLRFEIEVCKKLEELGFDFSDPVERGEKMRNILDKKEATFEIDVLGSHDSNLFVIECKSKWLNPLWYTQRYQEYRRHDLIEEVENKMPKRIEWVKNSLRPSEDFSFYRRDPLTGKRKPERRCSLGYPLSDYTIHGVIVTLFEELIQKYKDIIILPIERLDEIRNLFQ